MDVRYVCGIDPGCHGALCLIETERPIILVYPLPDTEVDCVDLIQEYASAIDILALEKVHSFPGQGVSSTFKFGQGYGFLRGVILSARIPLIDVTPQTWQKSLSCLSHGDKNVTKSKAQTLYPSIKITHTTADGILIATWAKQTYGKNSLRSVQLDRLPIINQEEVVVQMACKDKGKDKGSKMHEGKEKSTKKGGKKK